MLQNVNLKDSRLGPRSRWFVGLIAASAVLNLHPRSAWAQVPGISTQVAGTCPDQATLERHLAAVFREEPVEIHDDLPSPDDVKRSYELLVEHLTGSPTRFYLQSQGTVLLDRELSSSDCNALAQAIAIVVHTHFVQLDFDSRSAPPVATTDTTSNGSSSSDTKEPTRPSIGVSSIKRAPSSSQTTHRRNNISRWFVSGGIQFDGYSPQLTAAPGALLGLGLQLGSFRSRWQVRGSTPVILFDDKDSIRRTPIATTLGAHWSTSGRIQVSVGVAAGAALAWMIPTHTTAPRRAFAVSPLLEGDFRVHLANSSRWRPWLALRVGYLFLREEYRIAPRGVIGRGPRLSYGITLGTDFSIHTVYDKAKSEAIRNLDE